MSVIIVPFWPTSCVSLKTHSQSKIYQHTRRCRCQ